MGCCSSQADRHNDVLVEEGLEKSQQHCGETDYADIERWQRTDKSVRGLTQAQINYYYFCTADILTEIVSLMALTRLAQN